jgi:hypothetical protein
VGQTETFNRFTYTAPAGFQKNQDNKRVMFEKVAGSTFCQLLLWCMTDSRGSNRADFDNDWKELVLRNVTVKGTPKLEKQTHNGWQILIGMAEASFQNTPLVAMLITCTKGNESFSISSNFNDPSYVSQVTGFLDKLDITDNRPTAAANSTPTNKQPMAAQTSGISLATTNFDDGWVATITSDYVRVTRTGGVEVRIYYPDPRLHDSRPRELGFVEHYWNVWVKPDFQTSEPGKRPHEIGMDDILEATTTYSQTRQRGFVTIKLHYNNGVCTPIVAFAPAREQLYQLFPDHSDFDKMLNYNKFAVNPVDLKGEWSTSGGGSISYYSVYTGQYVGSNTAATGDRFVFAGNGSYQSRHSYYTSGGGGGKQTYSGAYKANVWTLNLTNRGENDPGEFSCHFEAVKGGRILHMVNKKFTGQRYSLFKEK